MRRANGKRRHNRSVVEGLRVFLVMVILASSLGPTFASADVMWSDNFNDGIPDGWTFFGYESIASPIKTEGNFSAASGMLTVLDDDINVARYNSTTNVGTWSFDMFVPDDDAGTIYLEFMSNGADHFELPNSSVICVGAWLEEDKFLVWELVGTGYHIHKSIYVDPLQGWHHIDVSRTSDARFLVYFNGTIKANFTSNTVTNSTYLQLFCEHTNGAAIDNLVVRDDPYYTTTTTTTTTTGTEATAFPLELLVIAVGGAAVVVIVAVVFLRRR